VSTLDQTSLETLTAALKQQARVLGFQQLGIADTDLDSDRDYLERWLQLERHGAMQYMARHGRKRSTPEELVPGTIRVIAVRMDYFPEPQADARSALAAGDRAYIARYALGRDYHKLMRKRLQALADWLEAEVGSLRYRVFVDSAPVLERALARKAGLGWIDLIDVVLAFVVALARVAFRVFVIEHRARGFHDGERSVVLRRDQPDELVLPFRLEGN
jgi:epoxyqueuosine reductase